MRSKPPVFTKEKAAFLAVALLTAVLAHSYFATRPLKLEPGNQLAFSKKDPARLNPLPDSLRDESAYFTGTRKSPFFVDWPKPPIGTTSSAGGKKGPDDFGKKNPNEKKDKDDSVSPRKLYEFAGVVIYEGTAHALLQVRGKTETVRAEEGGTIDGGYKVTRVNKQSIELTHASGKTYLLRDRPQ